MGHPGGRAVRGEALLREVRGDVNCGCHRLRGSNPGKRVDEVEKGTFSASLPSSIRFHLLFQSRPHVLTALGFFWCRCRVFLNYFRDSVEGAMLCLCTLGKDAGGGQCLTQSSASETECENFRRRLGKEVLGS